MSDQILTYNFVCRKMISLSRRYPMCPLLRSTLKCHARTSQLIKYWRVYRKEDEICCLTTKVDRSYTRKMKKKTCLNSLEMQESCKIYVFYL